MSPVCPNLEIKMFRWTLVATIWRVPHRLLVPMIGESEFNRAVEYVVLSLHS